MKIAVSACLTGCNCKYNGGNNYNQKVMDFLADNEVIEVCPEMFANMGTPRVSVEIVDGVVTDKNGKNVHKEYVSGVQRAIEQVKQKNIDIAILQSRSPTCGVKQIYDGSFSKKLIPGMGLFAQALKEEGIRVIDCEDL